MIMGAETAIPKGSTTSSKSTGSTTLGKKEREGGGYSMKYHGKNQYHYVGKITLGSFSIVQRAASRANCAREASCLY